MILLVQLKIIQINVINLINITLMIQQTYVTINRMKMSMSQYEFLLLC